MQGSNTENYKTLLREIKEDENKQRVDHVYGLEEFILLRFQFSPNWSIDSTQPQS